MLNIDLKKQIEFTTTQTEKLEKLEAEHADKLQELQTDHAFTQTQNDEFQAKIKE